MYALVVAILLLVGYIFHQLYWKRRHLPPGPLPLPIVGNAVSLLSAKNPVDQLIEWRRQYGPVYTVWLGSMPQVFLTEFDVIQEAFMKNGDQTSGRFHNYALNIIRGGNKGIIMSEGPLWREQRRFSLHVLRDFGVGRSLMEDNIMTETKAMLAAVAKQIDDDGRHESDVKPHVELCIGSIINTLVFGYRYENERIGEFRRMKHLLDEQVTTSGQALIFLLGPITQHLPFIRGAWNKIYAGFQEILSFLNTNISEHRKTFDPDVEPIDFTYAYLKQIHELKKKGESTENYSDLQLMNIVLDLWAAGLETTVTTLRWAFLYMLNYPEVQRKVQQELHSVVSKDRYVTLADRPQLSYLVATLNEVQRMANILPLNVPHRTTQSMTVGGWTIPDDVVISAQMSVVHMDERHFPSPHSFRPERFLLPDGKTLKKVDELMPFSLGKRQCMGESLARMELFLVFANFMHKFRLDAANGKAPPTLLPIFGTTVQPRDHTCTVSKLD